MALPPRAIIRLIGVVICAIGAVTAVTPIDVGIADRVGPWLSNQSADDRARRQATDQCAGIIVVMAIVIIMIVAPTIMAMPVTTATIEAAAVVVAAVSGAGISKLAAALR